MRHSPRQVLPSSTAPAEPRPKQRALLLLLIILLLIFVGMMQTTGGYQLGGPVLGSILLIGLGAANCAR